MRREIELGLNAANAGTQLEQTFLRRRWFQAVRASHIILLKKTDTELNRYETETWADWAAWLPDTCQVGRLVRRPSGPPR